MDWIRFLFRWNGRIRRGQLIVWSFGVGLLSTLASMALVFAFLPRDPVLGGWPADARFWSIWSLGQLPGWVAIASLMARRLHDLGKSAVWLIPIFAYFAVLQLVVFTWPGINNTWSTAGEERGVAKFWNSLRLVRLARVEGVRADEVVEGRSVDHVQCSIP